MSVNDSGIGAHPDGQIGGVQYVALFDLSDFVAMR